MQIAVSSNSNATSMGDISATVTIPDVPYRALVVFGGVTIPNMALTAFTSGTFNGVSMDYLGYARNSNPNGDYYYAQAVSAFVMQQPPVGDYTCHITGPGTSYYTAMKSIVLTSTSLSGSIVLDTQKASTGTYVTMNTTKQSGAVIYCSGCYNSTYSSPRSGVSIGSFATANGGTNVSRWYVGFTETDGVTPVTAGWLYSSISRPSTIGIALNPVFLGANFRAVIL